VPKNMATLSKLREKKEKVQKNEKAHRKENAQKKGKGKK
jgi:hypothetical protein